MAIIADGPDLAWPLTNELSLRWTPADRGRGGAVATPPGLVDGAASSGPTRWRRGPRAGRRGSWRGATCGAGRSRRVVRRPRSSMVADGDGGVRASTLGGAVAGRPRHGGGEGDRRRGDVEGGRSSWRSARVPRRAGGSERRDAVAPFEQVEAARASASHPLPLHRFRREQTRDRPRSVSRRLRPAMKPSRRRRPRWSRQRREAVARRLTIRRAGPLEGHWRRRS